MPSFNSTRQATIEFDPAAGDWLIVHPSPIGHTTRVPDNAESDGQWRHVDDMIDTGSTIGRRFATLDALVAYIAACAPAVMTGYGWRPPAVHDMTRPDHAIQVQADTMEPFEDDTLPEMR
jgi:hypothetical protein